MKPTNERAEKKADPDDVCGPEQFVRQVEDDSLPAAQVLTEQREGREAQNSAPIFVP